MNKILNNMNTEKPILYSYFRSSASYRVRIALNLKKIEYTYESVHLLNNGGEQNTLNYKAVNPMSQVPTFVDGHNLISQSMAIIQYIDEKWSGGVTLFPQEAYLKSQIIEFCELINSGIQPLQNLLVLQKLEKDFQADQKKKDEWCQFFISKGMESLEKKVKDNQSNFCFGNQITAAECFLIPQIFASQRFGVSMDSYPSLKRIAESCSSIEAFKKAHPSCQPDTPIEN